MAISINDVNKPTINNSSQTTATNRNKGQENGHNNTLSSQDTVALTDTAKQVQQLEKQLQSYPVVDADKVAEARENLNSGNYVISAERIAAKLSQTELYLQQAS